MYTGMSTVNRTHARPARKWLSFLEAPVGIESTNSRFAVISGASREIARFLIPLQYRTLAKWPFERLHSARCRFAALYVQEYVPVLEG